MNRTDLFLQKSDLLQFHRSSSTFSTSAEVSKDVSVNIMDMP